VGRWILNLFVIAGLPAVAAAQQTSLPQVASPAEQPPQAAPPVFRSGADLVALNVAVLDQSQHFVRGLAPGDFAVYEDGVRQEVSFFAAQEVPLDLILLVDTSSSMTDKMSTVRAAALGFLRTLRPIDRGAVVTFADGVRIEQPLTRDTDTLVKAVNGTQARGATALYNAIYVALKEFGRAARQTGDVRRQAIAVLSDGEDTCSMIGFDDVLDLAKRTGVTIFTIGLRSPTDIAVKGSFDEALYSMKTLAQETGAQAFFPTEVRQLDGIYGKIAEELDSQYALGYTPKNNHVDGRFRRIIVQILSHPELRPRARTGYFAERGAPSATSRALTTASSGSHQQN
jgi:Ca-activated chloride channel family protein